MKKKNIKSLKIVLLSIILTAIAIASFMLVQDRTHDAKVRRNYENTIQQLNEQRSKLELEQNKTIDQQKQLDETNKKLQETEKQLQAKRARASAYAATLEYSVPTISAAEAKAYIYQHESGNRTTAVNEIGCRGLGQACPGSKLPCGDDYACQDTWFTNYMLQRYGSWQNAYAFWVGHKWW